MRNLALARRNGFHDEGERKCVWWWLRTRWVWMDESLEREMGMRDVSGSEGYVHGNENGLRGDGNGLAWT